jgi:hypothetical protein
MGTGNRWAGVGGCEASDTRFNWFYKLNVNALKIICLAIIQLVKRAWLLPQAVANAVKQMRRRAVLNAHEVERLDRIRNPSKYLGKP